MNASGANFRFSVLVLVSVILINIDAHTNTLSPVRALSGLLITPLQQLVLIPSQFAEWIGGRAISTPELRDQLTQVKNANLQLRVRQQQISSLQAENHRLRQLLSASPRGLNRVMLAELVDVSLEPYSQSLLLNKGLSQEVFLGQPVLDAQGVMGQVVQTSYYRSAVALITDPGQTVPVMIERNGFRALTVGVGQSDQLDVPYLNRNTDIRKGDLLITSGMGGRFPYGYPVATVRTVTVDVNEPFLRIIAEPIAKLNYSREVLLAWPGDTPAPIDPPGAVVVSEKQTSGDTPNVAGQ